MLSWSYRNWNQICFDLFPAAKNPQSGKMTIIKTLSSNKAASESMLLLFISLRRSACYIRILNLNEAKRNKCNNEELKKTN